MLAQLMKSQSPEMSDDETCSVTELHLRSSST